MINMPTIDFKDTKLLIIIFIIFISLFFFNKFEIKSLVSIIVVVIIIINYTDIKEIINKNILTVNNNVKLEYNNKIEELLKLLKKYKNDDKLGYKNGIKYWYKFMEMVNILEDDDIYNYNQYFENAQLYLNESINTFQSLSINSNENNYIDSLKYGKLMETKRMNDISEITKELYKEGYNILYNLSITLNKRWKENPNKHNKEINFEYPLPVNEGTTNFDFYV